jgi:16S rRNA (guanine1207-N2)-methyltransferase
LRHHDAVGHYFETPADLPPDPRTVELLVGGRRLALRTDPGVFSRARLDPGTAVLLETAPPPPPTGALLDIGCGYGPIALTMAALAPNATVWAIDVNRRARELCAANAAAERLGNVHVAAPDEVPPDIRFDAIWSNPPIRIGKDALHALLRTWLGRLAPDGEALLVVQRHLGSDSLHRWLQAEGWPTRRIASRKGFRVLQAAPRSTA